MQRLTLPCFLLVYAFLSLYVMAVFIPYSFYGFDYGNATRPIRPVVYRVLVPTVIQTLRHATPASVEAYVTPKLLALRDSPVVKNIPGYEHAGGAEALNAYNIYNTCVMMLVVYLTLVGFVVMLYRLARGLFPESHAYAFLAPVVALLSLPIFIRSYAYTYDFAELFLTTTCLYLLLKERWWLYLVCLCLTTLNKETSIFLLIFFALYYYRRLPRAEYAYLLAWQFIIYGFIKGMLNLYYSDLPGVTFGNLIMVQIPVIYNYQSYSLLWLVFLLLLFSYQWMQKPAFLRYGAWMVLANIPAFIWACNPGEYRDFYGSMPIMFLLATHTLVQWMGIASLPLFQRVSKPV